MSHSTKLMALVALIGITSGCNTRQMYQEQSGMRDVLLRLYEEQLMDNLIRANAYLPIVHVDYSSVSGVMTNNRKFVVGAQGGGADNTLAAFSSGIVRTLNWLAFGSAEGSQNNAVTLAGAPATGKEIAEPYIRFLNEMDESPVSDESDLAPGVAPAGQQLIPTDNERQRKHLKWSSVKPKAGACHVVHERDGVYYWVPVSSAPRFFQLFQETTLLRTPKGSERSILNQLELLRLEELTD